MIPLIPYAGIANIIALGFMAYAFIGGESRGRIVIASLGGATFLLPELFPSQAIWIISLISRVVIAVGCYLYARRPTSLL
jgi:hypothetical protein